MGAKAFETLLAQHVLTAVECYLLPQQYRWVDQRKWSFSYATPFICNFACTDATRRLDTSLVQSNIVEPAARKWADVKSALSQRTDDEPIDDDDLHRDKMLLFEAFRALSCGTSFFARVPWPIRHSASAGHDWGNRRLGGGGALRHTHQRSGGPHVGPL